MPNLINTAVSGLKLSELALSVTGQNIVNANTEGYSRQTLEAETGPSTFNGTGYLGTGVNVGQIQRNTQQFLIDQHSTDLSILGEFDQYLANIDQIDSLLADPATSIAASMDNYFAAMNGVVNNPAGSETRQLLLTQTQILVNEFKSSESKLLNQNESLNRQLDSFARTISSIAKEISELNSSISESPGIASGNLPNNLLDKRDELVRELATIVDVKASIQPNLTMNIFIGEGQGLVIGPQPATLVAIPGQTDPSKMELAFSTNGEPQVVTRQLTGGELGGAIRFREEALDPAINSLGRIALSLTDSVNEQQALGVDLEGNLGKPVFTDINDTALARNRVKVDAGNALPSDRVLGVNIDDLTEISTSDYRLNFPGPGSRYSIVRLSDNALVDQGNLSSKLPDQVSLEGFTINFESGSFQEGDSFLIQPTRTAVGDLSVLISRAEEYALASPLQSRSNIGNQGGAFVSALNVQSIDTPNFQQSPGELSPPVMIRFTSASRYDVLDISDPSNPVPLQPPLKNRQFVPGANNAVFPEELEGTSVSTLMGNTASIKVNSASNGYEDETLRITRVDPESGFSSEAVISVLDGASADDTAARMSAVEGVFATAYSQLELSNFTSDGEGQPLGVSLNGVDLLSAELVQGRSLPDPVNSDFLRDSINGSSVLQSQGIVATSNGLALTVFGTTGVDLAIKVTGTGGDSVQLRDGDLLSIIGSENLKFGYTAPVNSGFDIDLGFGASSVALTPGVISGSNTVETIQADIDRALGTGIVDVELSPMGQLLLKPTDNYSQIVLTNITDPDIFGIAPTVLAGPDIGEQPATLGPFASAASPLDFSTTNGSFNVLVNGIYSDTISLSASYPSEGGEAIVDAINTQILASTGASGLAGELEARLSDSGGIEFFSSQTGPGASLSISSVLDMQGLVENGVASGSQLTGTQAELVGNISVNEGADFDVGGPHQFALAVDGFAGVTVNLTGSTRLAAEFQATIDVSSGVDLSAMPNTFELSIAGAPNVMVDISGVDTSLAASPFDSAPQGIVDLIQERIDAAVGVNSVNVGLGSGNQITLTTVATGASASVTVSNPTGSVATDIFPVVGTAVGTELGASGVVDLVQSAINDSLSDTETPPVSVGVDNNGFLTLTSSTYGEGSQISIASVNEAFGYLFPGISEGEQYSNIATVGGSIDVQLGDGVTLLSNKPTGLFGEQPKGVDNYIGYQVYINSGQSGAGLAQAGDSFSIDFNNDGANDNSNALALLAISDEKVLSNGSLSLNSAYAQIVEKIGILTNQSRISQEASESLVRQSEATLQSISGVNIDEEAANLIKFEQHYNASAQLISIARDLFDSILQI